jgi:hypothetical protein
VTAVVSLIGATQMVTGLVGRLQGPRVSLNPPDNDRYVGKFRATYQAAVGSEMLLDASSLFLLARRIHRDDFVHSMVLWDPNF